MTRTKKPIFLKTFSEFTIGELRTMSLQRVLSLFVQEVSTTFTEPKSERTPKKNRTTKKKRTTTISSRGFSDAMKRIFTIHASLQTHQDKKVAKIAKTETKMPRTTKEKVKPKQEETVVFSSHPTPEDSHINGVL